MSLVKVKEAFAFEVSVVLRKYTFVYNPDFCVTKQHQKTLHPPKQLSRRAFALTSFFCSRQQMKLMINKIRLSLPKLIQSASGHSFDERKREKWIRSTKRRPEELKSWLLPIIFKVAQLLDIYTYKIKILGGIKPSPTPNKSGDLSLLPQTLCYLMLALIKSWQS